MTSASGFQIVDATILFCDIRGFTALVDNHPPDEVFAFFSTVFEKLVSNIESHAGTVNKVMGDGLLAVFTPLGSDLKTDPKAEGEAKGNHHANRACRAALEIIKSLRQLNDARFLTNQSVLSVGMGLHSGQIATGRIKIGDYRERSCAVTRSTQPRELNL